MNHSSDLANIIDGASEARVTIRDAQEKAIAEDTDKAQIDMFNNNKNDK